MKWALLKELTVRKGNEGKRLKEEKGKKREN